MATLFTFADNQGLSIDWLLFGREPELREVTRPIGDLERDLHDYCARACATGELAGFTKAIAERLPSKELLDDLAKAARERIQRDLRVRSRALRETTLEYLRKKADGLVADPLKRSDVPLFLFRGAVRTVLSQKEFPLTTGLLNDSHYDDAHARELIAEQFPEAMERHEKELMEAVKPPPTRGTHQ